MSIINITPRNDAGTVSLKNQTLRWEVDSENILEIAISQIKLIGEYTTINARYTNDWFLALVLKNDEMFQLSMYAGGMQEVLTELGKNFDSDFTPLLALERDFKSSVIWPATLRAEPLYELRETESKSWFDRFRARLGFGNPLELVIREDIKNKLSV